MRKNSSRIISFGRYRATDLLIFAAIIAGFDVMAYFAFTEWFASNPGNFYFSIAVPVALLVMVRWNWYGVFYAVFDGVLYCALAVFGSGGAYQGQALQYFLTYGIGNAFVGLACLMVRFMGYRRIARTWYFTLLYVLCGWFACVLGRSAVSACFGTNFFGALLSFMGPTELLSLAMGAVLMLIMRRLDGMFENQRDYLMRLDEERREKMRRDTFGDEPIEVDEEALRSLNKKGGDMF